MSIAHELFAHECFAYTGEGREHSERCKHATARLADLEARLALLDEAVAASTELAEASRIVLATMAINTPEDGAEVSGLLGIENDASLYESFMRLSEARASVLARIDALEKSNESR